LPYPIGLCRFFRWFVICEKKKKKIHCVNFDPNAIYSVTSSSIHIFRHQVHFDPIDPLRRDYVNTQFLNCFVFSSSTRNCFSLWVDSRNSSESVPSGELIPSWKLENCHFIEIHQRSPAKHFHNVDRRTGNVDPCRLVPSQPADGCRHPRQIGKSFFFFFIFLNYNSVVVYYIVPGDYLSGGTNHQIGATFYFSPNKFRNSPGINK
jgi:hypothetical protein